MFDVEDYLPVLTVLDVNTIRDCYDEELLCTLYKEIVGEKLPRDYSLQQLATHVRYSAVRIQECRQRLKRFFIDSKDALVQVIEKETVESLCRMYTKDELYDMYVSMFLLRPKSEDEIVEYAQALKRCVSSMSRV